MSPTSYSSDDEDEDVLIDNEFWEPVYEGANISTVGAYCAIMEFKRACRLSFSTIAMLLQLLQLLCPSHNKLFKSIYTFKKSFRGNLIHLNVVNFVVTAKLNIKKARSIVIIVNVILWNLTL